MFLCLVCSRLFILNVSDTNSRPLWWIRYIFHDDYSSIGYLNAISIINLDRRYSGEIDNIINQINKNRYEQRKPTVLSFWVIVPKNVRGKPLATETSLKGFIICSIKPIQSTVKRLSSVANFTAASRPTSWTGIVTLMPSVLRAEMPMKLQQVSSATFSIFVLTLWEITLQNSDSLMLMPSKW